MVENGRLQDVGGTGSGDLPRGKPHQGDGRELAIEEGLSTKAAEAWRDREGWLSGDVLPISDV